MKALKFLLNFEEGLYFDANGDIKPQLSMQYKKAKHFSLKPEIDYLPLKEDGTPDFDQQTYGWYSIDGEKYPPCEIKGITLNKKLAVTML